MAQTSGWRGDEFAKLSAVGAASGLTKAAEFLRGQSVPLVPVDRGDLEDSASVQPATVSDLEATVSYDTPYAVIQHERLDFHHSEGQAKYLEGPLEENRGTLQELIATEVRRATGG